MQNLQIKVVVEGPTGEMNNTESSNRNVLASLIVHVPLIAAAYWKGILFVQRRQRASLTHLFR